MANFYVSGSTPSAPVTHVKLFISYALNHVTTAIVKDVFDSIFNNEVTQIEELVKKDRDTGKTFKLFWITLEPARHSPVWRFVDEIEKFDKASIIYESHKGKDFYWQVRLNKDKIKPVKTMPRIMPRAEVKEIKEVDVKEVTTSETATEKERTDAIAFTKTPEFSKLVESIVFEGVIEPKLEVGEIPEKRKLSSEDKKVKKPRKEAKAPEVGDGTAW
jgi:hypothetical protein